MLNMYNYTLNMLNICVPMHINRRVFHRYLNVTRLRLVSSFRAPLPSDSPCSRSAKRDVKGGRLPCSQYNSTFQGFNRSAVIPLTSK